MTRLVARLFVGRRGDGQKAEQGCLSIHISEGSSVSEAELDEDEDEDDEEKCEEGAQRIFSWLRFWESAFAVGNINMNSVEIVAIAVKNASSFGQADVEPCASIYEC